MMSIWERQALCYLKSKGQIQVVRIHQYYMEKKSTVCENNKAILLSRRIYHPMLLLINYQWLVLWYLGMKVTILSRSAGLNMRNRTQWIKLWVYLQSGTKSKMLSWLITYKSRRITTWELTTEKICLQVHTTLMVNSS